MVRLPRNEKQTHRLHSRLRMGPSGLTLTLTLTLNFQGQIWNWLYLSQKWSDCHETKNKHIDWTLGFKWDHRVWPWPWLWPWIFKVKYGIGYISAKNLGFKWDHRVWPWPWPWPWIFKVKYEICYISTKSGPIATRWKAHISIWILGLKLDNGFDLGHDLDIWIFKVICDLDHLVTKVRCKDLPDSDRGDFSYRRAVDSSSLIRNQESFIWTNNNKLQITVSYRKESAFLWVRNRDKPIIRNISTSKYTCWMSLENPLRHLAAVMDFPSLGRHTLIKFCWALYMMKMMSWEISKYKQTNNDNNNHNNNNNDYNNKKIKINR